MDTPETKTNIVFNDEDRRLPDGAISLTGPWIASHTVSLVSTLTQNSLSAPIDVKETLTERILEEIKDKPYVFLQWPFGKQLPAMAMADVQDAMAFVVRTSLEGAKAGEYLALGALDETHMGKDEVELEAGIFKRASLEPSIWGEHSERHVCWFFASLPNGTNATEQVAGVNSTDNDVPASPPNAVQVVIEFDPATQGFTCGLLRNGVPIENWNPFAVLQMLTQFINQLVGDCGFQQEQMIQQLKALQGNGQLDANQSRIVVASANTPLPPMPRMKQNPGRN